MRECYHEECDNKENSNISNESFEFMGNVAQALIYTIVEMSTESKPKCVTPDFGAPHFEKRPVRIPIEFPEPIVKTESENGGQGVLEELMNPDEALNEVDEAVLKDQFLYSMPEDIIQGLSKGQVQALFLKLLKLVQVDDDLTPFKKKPSQWFSAESSPNVRYNIGTQINIGSLNLGFSDERAKGTPTQFPPRFNENKADIVLGSENVNPNVLSNIIQGYYNTDALKPSIDRRNYQGKYKNSPMFIKLVDKTTKISEEL